MAGPVLISERRDAILLLTLNRPESRNALNGELVEALTLELAGLRSGGDIRAVVVTGAGEAFCSGADLSALRRMRDAGVVENGADSERLKAMYLAVLRCPLPVVAAVNGPALAGGCGLVTACDFVLAAEEASFGYPEVKIGFVAAMVSVLLARQLGERAARAMLLSGRPYSAAEARETGLVERVVSRESLLDDSIAHAQKLASGAPGAIAFTKELLLTTSGMPLQGALDHLALSNVFARQNGEVREGIDAFLARKRPPWNPR